ncbi:hypothetical protein HBH1_00355 [Herbaspirillum sp. BH-1]|uniref:hypothetical protein n=1 Tax=Herbaspirillum sp. (strain BH-1) TaxID=2058884 RepID=UPI000C880AA0|nr:hypothetical protein [Herbaspirillum sp. BH-1]PLY61381.1 hypothetical protein HBH1_00355 [Herbaspirillum sp. BH-1]
MRKTQIYGYYAFGFNYALLRSKLWVGPSTKREKIVELLEGFLNYLSDLDVQVSNRIAQPLVATLDKLRNSIAENLGQDLSDEIEGYLNRLDHALDAELELKYAYLMTKKRYPLESLMETPDTLLGNGVRETLADHAYRDFSFACVQIAYEQPTAAAFHLMRALEAQVKVLYYAFKKTKRLQNPMWGAIIKQLREKKNPRPSEKLLNHLDGMRLHFRNPTQHPDAFYNMDESQDLLNQTIAAISMIAAELPR